MQNKHLHIHQHVRTGETHEINKQQHIICNFRNLTYMIECRKRKKQYIGETKHTLRKRFTEYTDKQQTILVTQIQKSQHHLTSQEFQTCFLSPWKYFPRKTLPVEKHVNLFDGVVSSVGTETYLIYKAKTLSPLGLNCAQTQ